MAAESTPQLLEPLAESQNVWLAGSLFDCCADCEICCLTYFCPCWTYARNKKQLYGRGDPQNNCDWEIWQHVILYYLLGGSNGLPCAWTLSVDLRGDLKKKYGLPGEANDLCVHFWCNACALCQEARELKARAVTTCPPVEIAKTPEEQPESKAGSKS